MSDVVNADKVTVTRPIDLPKGTYNPNSVVVVDTGVRGQPLEHLPLGELMPNGGEASVFRANGTTRSENGVFSVDSISLSTGSDIQCDDGKLYLSKGYYHISASFVAWIDGDVADTDVVLQVRLVLGDTDITGVWHTFDLTQPESHLTMPLVCDVYAPSDGRELKLELSGLPDTGEPGEGAACVTMEQVSIHKITSVSSGGGGEVSESNVAIFDLMDYAQEPASDTLWVDMVSAMLDGKAVALKMPMVNTRLYSLGWSNRSFVLPDGYTKQQYLEELVNDYSEICTLPFMMSCDLYSQAVTMRYALDVSPSGIKVRYMAVIMPIYGVMVETYVTSVLTESVLPMNDAGDGLDMSKLGQCIEELHREGIPVTLTGYDATGTCMLNLLVCDRISWLVINQDSDTGFRLEAHGDAVWDGSDEYNGYTFPCRYKSTYVWVADAEPNHFEIVSDQVTPLAIDTRFVPQSM